MNGGIGDYWYLGEIPWCLDPRSTPITIPGQPAPHGADCLDDATVSGDLGLETGALPGGEVVHAGVIAVVHVVVKTADPIA